MGKFMRQHKLRGGTSAFHFCMHFMSRPIFPHDPPYFPFAECQPFVHKSGAHFPAAVQFPVLNKDFPYLIRKRFFGFFPLLPFLLITQPLIILALLDLKRTAHLRHRIQCSICEDCFAFHSPACMKMCRDRFKISTFSFSSASSFSFLLSSFSSSLFLAISSSADCFFIFLSTSYVGI